MKTSRSSSSDIFVIQFSPVATVISEIFFLLSRMSLIFFFQIESGNFWQTVRARPARTSRQGQNLPESRNSVRSLEEHAHQVCENLHAPHQLRTGTFRKKTSKKLKKDSCKRNRFLLQVNKILAL